ncbi:hypothetical protein Tco_0362471, partial [Tanacetum coccineum]
LIVEVEEKLVLIEEVVDDDLDESRNMHPHYVNSGFLKFVVAGSLSRETLIDNSCQSFPWLVHVVHKHVGVLVERTFIAKINEKGKCNIIIWYVSKVYTIYSWIDIVTPPKWVAAE